MGNCNDTKTTGVIDQKGQFEIAHLLKVNMTVTTWTKHQHGLYDYEDNENKSVKHLESLTSGIIYLNSGQIQFKSNHQQPLSARNSLVELYQEKEIYWLKAQIPPNQETQEDFGCYLVVNSLQSKQQKGYELQKGDWLKMGRVQMKLHEISINPNQHSEFFDLQKELLGETKPETSQQKLPSPLNENPYETSSLIDTHKPNPNINSAFPEIQSNTFNNLNSNQIYNQESDLHRDPESEIISQQPNQQLNHSSDSISQSQDQKKPFCRICLSDQITETENIMIRPCDCSGTMEFVHVNCLKQWIKYQQQAKAEKKAKIIAFISKEFKCELCQKSFPYKLTLDNGKIISLFSLKKPDGPYIILESKKSSGKDIRNGFLVLKLTENESIRIGRSHNCEVFLQDISVSRNHANLKYENGKLYLTDAKSKFGTLVLLRNDFAITQEIEGLNFQVGRHLLKFTTTINNSQQVKVPISSSGCCSHAITTQAQD